MKHLHQITIPVKFANETADVCLPLILGMITQLHNTDINQCLRVEIPCWQGE